MVSTKRGSALLAGALAAGALFASSSTAQAAEVIDQQSLISPTAATPIPVAHAIGSSAPIPSTPGAPLLTSIGVQSFTAGATGTLSRLEFQLSNLRGSGLFSVGLFDGNWVPGMYVDALAQTQTVANFLPNIFESLSQTRLFTFNVLDARYQVTPGKVFSVVFTRLPGVDPSAQTGLLIGTASRSPVGSVSPTIRSYNQYAGGSLTIHSFVENNYIGGSVASGDIGFRSFVDIGGAVPEPSTWAMLILGFGLIGAAMRRAGAVGQRSTPLTLPHVRAAV